MVKITLENFNENILFISEFLKITHYLTKGCDFTLFGGVVRDLIVPMSETDDMDLTLPCFKKMLAVEDCIHLNDIDVLYKTESTRSVRRVISDIKNKLHDMGWECILVEKDDSKEEPSFFKSSYDISVDRYKLYNSIVDVYIDIDFVIFEDIQPIIDFNTNNLTWDFENGFGLAHVNQSKSGFFNRGVQQLYGEISKIKQDIKNKQCEMLPSFIKNIGNNFKRVDKMRSKKYFIRGFENAFRSSYDDVDEEDRKCLICLMEFSENETCITVCGNNHFTHWKCGKSWWSKNQFACLICKNNCIGSL